MKNRNEKLIREYAELCITHENPWKFFEIRWEGTDDSWNQLTDPPSWTNDVEYRRRKTATRVGKFLVPEPLSESPPLCSKYYCLNVDWDISEFEWLGVTIDKARLKSGRVFPSRGHAEQFAHFLKNIHSDDSGLKKEYVHD